MHYTRFQVQSTWYLVLAHIKILGSPFLFKVLFFIFRGNLKEAISMFDKAIECAKTEIELAHLYSLRDATIAQQTVFQEMNLSVPNLQL